MAMSGLVAHGLPPFPKFMLYVKATIVFLSIIICALAAYATFYSKNILHYSSGVPDYLIWLVRNHPARSVYSLLTAV